MQLCTPPLGPRVGVGWGNQGTLARGRWGLWRPARSDGSGGRPALWTCLPTCCFASFLTNAPQQPPENSRALSNESPMDDSGEWILCSSEAVPVCMERIFTDVFLMASLCQFPITQGLGSWHLPSRLLMLHFLGPLAAPLPCPAHPPQSPVTPKYSTSPCSGALPRERGPGASCRPWLQFREEQGGGGRLGTIATRKPSTGQKPWHLRKAEGTGQGDLWSDLTAPLGKCSHITCRISDLLKG